MASVRIGTTMLWSLAGTRELIQPVLAVWSCGLPLAHHAESSTFSSSHTASSWHLCSAQHRDDLRVRWKHWRVRHIILILGQLEHLSQQRLSHSRSRLLSERLGLVMNSVFMCICLCFNALIRIKWLHRGEGILSLHSSSGFQGATRNILPPSFYWLSPLIYSPFTLPPPCPLSL